VLRHFVQRQRASLFAFLWPDIRHGEARPGGEGSYCEVSREDFVRDQLDVRGVSETVYRFSLFKEGRPLSPMGGNFLFVRETGGKNEILYAGEVQNLLKDAHSRWAEGSETFGATHLYTRLNISERVRQLEHEDIVEALSPPMNGVRVQKKAAG
jgi:hypothetical protein